MEKVSVKERCVTCALKFIDKSWKRKPRNFWTSYRYAFLVTAIDLNFSKNYQSLKKMQSAPSLTGILGSYTCTCTCTCTCELQIAYELSAQRSLGSLGWTNVTYEWVKVALNMIDQS